MPSATTLSRVKCGAPAPPVVSRVAMTPVAPVIALTSPTSAKAIGLTTCALTVTVAALNAPETCTRTM